MPALISTPVDFLICGTQKGGTSALDAYCRRHAALCMADVKEVHFFDDEAQFAAGKPDYTRYHAHFPAPVAGKLRGESTPIYLYWPNAAQRIHQYNPAMKLLVVLRDPAARAYSHWQMESRRGLDTLSFGEAIRREAQRLQAADVDHRRVYSYIDRGRYLEQLNVLWSLFGREQVLVLRSELLRADPAAVLSEVSGFLGIDPFPVVENMTVNRQDYDSAMPEEDRMFLHGVFEEEINALERALGWNLEDWKP